MNLQAQGVLKNKHQTPFWCGCQVVTSDVWQLTECPKSDLKMLKRRNLFTNYLQLSSCMLGRWALLWKMAKALAVSVKAICWECCGGAALAYVCSSALRCGGQLKHRQYIIFPLPSSLILFTLACT